MELSGLELFALDAGLQLLTLARAGGTVLTIPNRKTRVID